MELAALDQFKKYFTYLRTIQNILMTCWLSCEQSLPFGLLLLLLIFYLRTFQNILMTCCQVSDRGLLVDWIFFILAGNRTTINAWMSSNFGKIPPLTSELAVLERLKKIIVLALLRLPSSFLQVWRTPIISWTSLIFVTIRPRTAEFAAHERLKNSDRLIMGKILLAL